MKITIDIAHDLLRRAKATARQSSMTVGALVEEGLRGVLARRSRPRRRASIKPVIVKGNGLRPEAARLSWTRILAMASRRPGK